MIKTFFSLTKFHLSFTVSLSCCFGYILASNQLDINLLYPFLAVLFLSLGVCSLNQIQEYKEDALMDRTKTRPIPSGELSIQNAWIIAIGLIILSCFFIYIPHGIWGIALFILVIITYNLFYTRAKKYSIYAGVYGAILGVIPPYIGWLSTEVSTLTIQFFALALFFFTWQIPHFWLLNLKYHEEYEQAGFPTITQSFGKKRLERITFIWLLLTLLCGTFIVVVFQIQSLLILSLIACLTFYMLFSIFNLLKKKNYLYNFIHINVYMLLLMIILCTHALLYN